jgi:prolipoprotein diacylglyceryltransferase
VGLDSLLAHNCSRDPGCDRLAREVSERAAIVLDFAVWLAFLGGVCGARLASFIIHHCVPHNLDSEEALIEQCIP